MVMSLVHLQDNPIRKYRKREGKTIDQIAKDASVNAQGWYLTECGVYADPLPAIVSYLIKRGHSGTDLYREYREYVQNRRSGFGERHNCDPAELWLPASSLKQPPTTSFRQALGFSRMAFAKELCVQPALLYKLERGQKAKLPQQLSEALAEAGFSERLIEELDERVREYYDHVRG